MRTGSAFSEAGVRKVKKKNFFFFFLAILTENFIPDKLWGLVSFWELETH